MLAITATTDNQIGIIEFDEENSYAVLSNAVGGLIECISLESLEADMWINEEGKIIELEPNAFGTALWVRQFGFTDVIMGDIIITAGPDDEGNTKGLTTDQVDAIMEAVKKVTGI